MTEKKTVRSEGKTREIYPLLAPYGANMIYGPKEIFQKNNVICEYWNRIKLYNTEFQKKICNWKFNGHLLVIKDEAIRETAFCFNKKLFKDIVPPNYRDAKVIKKNKGFLDLDKVRCYSPNGEISMRQEEQILRYCQWIDKNLGITNLSKIYAMYFETGVVSIIFYGAGEESQQRTRIKLEESLEVL